MKQIKSIIFKDAQGQEFKADVEVYSRGGTKSPELDIVIYNGQRIVPYEFKRRGYSYTLNGLFKRIYSDKIEDLIPRDLLFPKIKKCQEKGSIYHQPIILGLERGITFKP